MSKTKLIAYRGDRAACWFYRIHSPLVYIARNNQEKFEISVSGSISKDQIGKYDVVILQRQYKLEVLAPALEMKKKGAKLIYEIDDDLFNIPEWNPAAKTLNVKKVQDGIKYFVSNVDAIFVTTEELRGIYRNYCENIYVLPNSVDSEIIYPCNRNTVKPVVCWQGSTTHERDLMVARAGFEQLAKDQDIIFKLWCGYDGKTREPAFNIPGAETLQLVPFEAFYQMFSQVGTYVGLAPLCANVFNKSKSNLKFLEYTVHDAVTVASNFGPYKDTIEDGVTGILVSDNSEWYEKVRMVLADQDMHKRILENAKRVVKENFSISTNYKLWDAAITDVLGRKDE